MTFHDQSPRKYGTGPGKKSADHKKKQAKLPSRQTIKQPKSNAKSLSKQTTYHDGFFCAGFYDRFHGFI